SCTPIVYCKVHEMRSAVTKEDEVAAMNTALLGLLVVLGGISSAIAAQPMQAISIALSLVVLGVIVYVNIMRPAKRRRILRKPVEAWFVIPTKKHHGCDFAVQDAGEHVTKTVVLPEFSEVLVDFSFLPKTFLANSELIIGCDGDNAPRPIE